MFGSKVKADPPGPTVIGKGCIVEGTVRASGPVQVDGRIDGALFAEGCHVAIGPSGSITGDVMAGDLAIGGRVEGTLSVLGHLHIATGASVHGAVCYGSLEVERGGVLIGRVLHDDAEMQIEITAEDPTPATPQLPASEPARA